MVGVEFLSGKKCQKIGHFSLEKAFFAFFLAMVLARTINFAEEKQRNYKPHANLAKNAKTWSYGYVSHRSHKSHRWQVASPLLVGYAECFQLDGSCEHFLRCSPFREICEICVRPNSAMKENFALFARFA